ncbi:hypothetical protein SAMN05444141_107195 [Pseudovibrio denitrificans]|uniref:Rhomboid family protein n=1 Tax=Pseudovibrio denitrificans TaxID=258256 RepID=A0A1I7D2E1_9HYPH|nr:hypothetical protein SAMN05444141_107195 [Pseudovibrio denitrificans]
MDRIIRYIIVFMFITVLGGGFILLWLLGGTVIDQKVEAGKYFFEFKNQKNVWVETTAFWYWTESIHNFIHLFGTIIFLCFAGWQYFTDTE